MSGPANHILVDANVARSARDPARHITSHACLALAMLLANKACATGAAFTPMLTAEWKKHASPYMVGWLASMESRGRVRREKDRIVKDLRSAIAKVGDDGIRKALLKDVHLSEAAIWNGLPVASQDDTQRRFLRDLANEYELAGTVQWMNPVQHADWEPWVEGGCVARSDFACGT